MSASHKRGFSVRTGYAGAGDGRDRREEECAAEIWNASRKNSELPRRPESKLVDP